MTAIAAMRAKNGIPFLVGDVALMQGDERLNEYACKVYRFKHCKNLVLAWAGDMWTASEAIGRLRKRLDNGPAKRAGFLAALDTLEDLRGADPHLLLTGWLADGDDPKVIRWDGTHERGAVEPLSDEECYIGDGGEMLSEMLSPASLREGNTEGEHHAALGAISGFIEKKCEEILHPQLTPETKSWGGAFDLVVLQGGIFRWLPALTYVLWNVWVDDESRIVEVDHLPIVFKQHRVHDATVMQAKARGTPGHVARVATAVDYEVEPGPEQYLRRDFSARSPYYANYFRVFRKRDDSRIGAASIVLANASGEGLMNYAGDDESDPRFTINVAKLNPMVQSVIRERTEREAPRS